MKDKFDRRVVPDDVLRLLRACQRRSPCVLGGGAALSGAYLGHRLSQDIDLFFKSRDDLRSLIQALPQIAKETGSRIELVRDAGEFVRAHCEIGGHVVELDAVLETSADIAASSPLEGIAVQSLEDLRGSKLTCLLSRSEPRDLVDLLFLERAGFTAEKDLPLGVQKARGVDPGVLAWLMGQFPTHPLPRMLEPLTEAELATFRDGLRERFKTLAIPPE